MKKFSILFATFLFFPGEFTNQTIVWTADLIEPVAIEEIFHVVKLTMYHPVRSQTDNDPDVLADGTRINIAKAGKYRFCALSRDLIDRWGGYYSFGDTIFVDGAGPYSGRWVVKDTMNERWKNRIDLLIGIGTTAKSYNNVIIKKV